MVPRVETGVTGAGRPVFARFSLRTKVTGLLLAISLAPLLVAGLANVHRAVQRGKLAEQSRQTQAASFAAAAFEDLFTRAQRNVELLARRVPVDSIRAFRPDHEPGARSPLVADLTLWRDGVTLAALDDGLATTFLARADGRVFFAHPFHNARDVQLSRTAWFERLRNRGGLAVGDLVPLTSLGAPSVIALAPIQRRGGQIVGYVGSILDPYSMDLIAHRALASASGAGSDHEPVLFLADRGGRIAVRAGSAPRTTVPERLQRLRPMGTVELDSPSGGEVVSRAGVNPSGWTVFVITKTAAAYRHVYELIWLLIGVIVLTFAFVLLLADVLASVLLRPIRELRRGAEMIGAGALDYRIELGVHQHDELGGLGRSFNAMAENLQRSERQIKAYSRNLETANQELDAMVFGITHDLKKSLRGIEAFATFLNEDYADALDDEGRDLLTSIGGNVDAINLLADDLIGLVEHGRERSTVARFSMSELLDEARERVQARRPGSVVIDPDMPDLIADRVRLLIAFDNLIDNGLKFNRSSLPVVEIRSSDDGAYWRFDVIDNGIGMEHRYHDQVFELFTRLHQQSEFSGTGTGLNLVRRIIEEHRGSIEVTSAPGRGSTFSVWLPKDPCVLTSPGVEI